jgi:hypothetical protein
LSGLIIIKLNQKQIFMEQIIEYWEMLTPLKKVQFPIFLGAIATYVWHIVKNKDFTPDPIAFGVWLFGDTISFLTTIKISKLWLAPALMPLGALVVFLISVIKIIKGKQGRQRNQNTSLPPPDQIIATVLAFISLALWGWSTYELVAYLAIQTSLAIGFYFIISKIVKSKLSGEPILSWTLFLIGWSVATYETILFRKSNWEFVLPLVNGGGALIILIITYYYRRSRI